MRKLHISCRGVFPNLSRQIIRPTKSKGPEWHQWGCPWVRDSPRLDLLVSPQWHVLPWEGCRQSLLLLLPPPPPLPHARGRSIKPPLHLPAPSSHTRTFNWMIWSRVLMPLTLHQELCSQSSWGLQNVIILGDTCDAKNIHTLFTQMSNYMYAYQGEAINCALTNYNFGCLLPTPTRQPPNVAICFNAGIMGPVCLYNSAKEIHAIFKAAHLEEEKKSPSYCQALDLITFLHLWRKHKSLEVSNLMKVTMKQWRPPIWTSEKVKKKKEHLCNKKRQALVAKMVVLPPPVIVKALQEHITSQPIQLPPGDSNSTLGNDFPVNLLAQINKQFAPPLSKAEESSSHPWGPITLNLKAQALPWGAPSLNAPVDDWVNFIEKCQMVCPSSSCGGLCKMFLGMVGCNIYPDNEDSDLNPLTQQQVWGFLIMECLAPIPWMNFNHMVWVWGLIHLLMVLISPWVGISSPTQKWPGDLDWPIQQPGHHNQHCSVYCCQWHHCSWCWWCSYLGLNCCLKDGHPDWRFQRI